MRLPNADESEEGESDVVVVVDVVVAVVSEDINAGVE